MSQSKFKTRRKMMRKEVKEAAAEYAKYLGSNLKPRPKWIPWGIYKRLLGLFIKMK